MKLSLTINNKYKTNNFYFFFLFPIIIKKNIKHKYYKYLDGGGYFYY